MANRKPDTLIAIAGAVAIVQSSPARAVSKQALIDDLLARGLARNRSAGQHIIRAGIADRRLRLAGDSVVCHFCQSKTRAAIAAAVALVNKSAGLARDGISPACLRKSLVLDLIAGGFVGSRSAGYRVLQAAVFDSDLCVDSDLFALLRLP